MSVSRVIWVWHCFAWKLTWCIAWMLFQLWFHAKRLWNVVVKCIRLQYLCYTIIITSLFLTRHLLRARFGKLGGDWGVVWKLRFTYNLYYGGMTTFLWPMMEGDHFFPSYVWLCARVCVCVHCGGNKGDLWWLFAVEWNFHHLLFKWYCPFSQKESPSWLLVAPFDC